MTNRNKGYALARAELIRVLTAYSGIATADGAVGGTTIIDSNLIGENDFITEKTLLIMSGDAQYESRGALAFNNITGTITAISAFIDSAGAPAQIMAGTIFRVLNIPSLDIVLGPIAAIEAKLDDATTGLAALKLLIDAIEGKLDVIGPEVIAIEAKLDDGTTGLAALKALIDALEAKLDDGTTGLAALKALIDAIEGKLDDPASGLAALQALIMAVGGAVVAVELKLDDGTTGLAALKALIDALETKLDDGTTGLAALKDLIDDLEAKLDFAFKVFPKVISSAANAGDVTIATVGAHPVIIDSIVLMANTPQTANMTSCAIYGVSTKVITFIDALTAIQANLNAADKQVAWTGAVRLAVGKTIVISLVGTGAAAVDLTVTITYHAEVAGGVLS